MSKTVVIVEDDPALCESLTELLADAPDLKLLWCSESAENCLERLSKEESSPELFVVDLGLPGVRGPELIAELKQRLPLSKCLAHTVFEDRESVFAALRAGADGYLLKGSDGPQFLRHLRSLEEGGAPLTPRVARYLVSEFQSDAENPLTSREQDVLQCLSKGFSYQQCAEQLVVSSHTVHTHVKKIYEKLAVRGRNQAVDKARKRGWI
ncbi:MAG: response regulator transcription factor [Candidatus Eremiobacteraeota bacterium]|nr:response regulator transcription factor [Candidatus Eremiobacteraeota bacterium]